MKKLSAYPEHNATAFVYLFLLAWLAVAATSIASCSNLPLCDEKSHPTYMNGSHITVKVGTVFTNGEYCDIEEVQQVFIIPCTGIEGIRYEEDTSLHCKYCPTSNHPKVRRLICPSGKNGESTVGHDNTKYHNEVIQ